MYDSLIEEIFLRPRVTTEYRDIDFKSSWKIVCNKFIYPEVRACMYKTVHGVLPTNVFLFNYTTQEFFPLHLLWETI